MSKGQGQIQREIKFAIFCKKVKNKKKRKCQELGTHLVNVLQ